jgi:hypothetical protein
MWRTPASPAAVCALAGWAAVDASGALVAVAALVERVAADSEAANVTMSVCFSTHRR